MKNLFSVALFSLCAVSSRVLADTAHFETSKHHIQITCDEAGRHSDHCVYQSWNKPKKAGQGKPDLEITQGTFQSVDLYTTGYCVADNYVFQKGNLTITLGYDMKRADNGYDAKHVDRACFPKPPPKDANGELRVYINGKQKSRYWVY